MNQSEKHKFEEEWERMFESASETPPPTLWDAIERRLDGEDTPAIIPLVWWKNPKIAYAAAAAVALLLVSWPLLRQGSERTESATQVASRPITKGNPEAVGRTDAFEPASSPAEIGAGAEEKVASTSPKKEKSRSIGLSPEATPSLDSGEPLLSALPNNKVEVVGTQEVPAAGTGRNISMPTESAAVALTVPNQLKASGAVEPGNQEKIAASGFSPILNESIARVSPVEVSEVDVHFQKRFVFYNYEFPEADITPPTQHKEYWAGVGIMPASFNPGVSVTSPPAAFSQAKASRQSLSNSSKAGLSYAAQLQTGMKLSKHWSIETGLNYLQGNSTFESDGYVLDASTNRSANVLEDALLSGSTYSQSNAFSPGIANDPSNIVALYIDLDQKITNDYRFMQVPVQAGYTLNPDGKVNYTVLGGTVANLFLRNEIEAGTGSRFVNTADDGLYRSLSWSAATGVRLNYRLSDHWNASLTGSYQKALSTSLRSSSSLDSRPQLYGLSWGVRYVF